MRVGGVVQRAGCGALRTLQKAMQHFGAAPSTLEVKGGPRYLHLLLLASLVAAEARVPSGAHENMIKHLCTTSTLSDHLGKHGKHVELHQGSGAELSTRFATTGGEEQRRGERRPLVGGPIRVRLAGVADGKSDLWTLLKPHTCHG